MSFLIIVIFFDALTPRPYREWSSNEKRHVVEPSQVLSNAKDFPDYYVLQFHNGDFKVIKESASFDNWVLFYIPKTKAKKDVPSDWFDYREFFTDMPTGIIPRGGHLRSLGVGLNVTSVMFEYKILHADMKEMVADVVKVKYYADGKIMKEVTISGNKRLMVPKVEILNRSNYPQIRQQEVIGDESEPDYNLRSDYHPLDWMLVDTSVTNVIRQYRIQSVESSGGKAYFNLKTVAHVAVYRDGRMEELIKSGEEWRSNGKAWKPSVLDPTDSSTSVTFSDSGFATLEPESEAGFPLWNFAVPIFALIGIAIVIIKRTRK